MPIRRFATLALLLGGVACGDEVASFDDPVDIAEPWQTLSPFDAAVDVVQLNSAINRASRIRRMRSLLISYKGRLLVEEYFRGATVDSLADVRSVTKSIVGTLAGIALDEGRIESLDDPITEYLRAPEYPITERHQGVTIRHLLTMGSGFEWMEAVGTGYNDWIFADDHVAFLLDRPLAEEPGARFNYNSAAVHLLGLVVEEAVGRPLPAYAGDVLFGPLGIEEVVWEELSSGAVNGGSGIDLRPRDLARIGLLFAQEGRSGQQPLVSMEWIGESTDSRWPQLGPYNGIRELSYGYLWWIDRTHGAHLAWGYGGQFVYVDPDTELVVVATTDWVGVSQDGGARALESQVLDIIVGGVVPAIPR